MISATSFDIQVLGELDKQSPSPRPDHFITLYVNEKERITSQRKRRMPAPRWQEKQTFQFDVKSTIKIVIFRRSLISKKRYAVAKYIGRGIDLLANDAEHELTNESGGKISPRFSMRLDFVSEDHAEFMKTVDKDMLRLVKIKCADGAQIATTIGEQLGIVLQKIVPVIDAFATTHPILNAAWIVLSSAYKLIQNQIALDDAVRDLVEIFREMAGLAAACPNLPEIGGTVDIIEEIGITSLDAALIIHRYADPSIAGKPSILARTAKLSVSNAPSQIADCRKRCAALILALHGRVQLDTNVRVRWVQDTQKKNDIHIWMRASDSSPNYNAAREKHQAETGSWFIDGTEFTEWKEEPGSVLWLDGGPGCGKTITCATSIKNVIDSCASRPSVGYAYFFFDGTSARAELRSHENLIKSIIIQLADRCDGIPAALDKMYRACDNGHRQPDLPLLEETLLSIVDDFDRTYIIIDSLDECAERLKVLKWIQSITAKAAGNLHMMVTSRPEKEIESAFLSLSARMRRISITDYLAANDDIRHFIDGRLSELPKWSEEWKKKVRDVLIRDANGMFRWVALMFDELLECETNAELDEQLKSLPRGLNEIYSRILARSSRPDDIKRFLRWLAYSRRPLTVQEIAEVVVINFGQNESAVPVHEDGRRYNDPNAVLRICSGLVTEIEGNVKLAHSSVNEYLAFLDIADAVPGVALQYRTSECISHAMIAQTCIAYLQQFDTPESITAANVESFPLALYAANFWINHFHSARTDINNFPVLQNLMLGLFRPSTHCAFINWIQIRQDEFERETDAFGAPLWYACAYGVTEVVQLLIDQGADRKAEVGCINELAVASAFGHLEIVKLLLKNGVHLGVEGGEQYGLALERASGGGHLEIIKVLLGTGAHLDTAGGKFSYGEALVLASSGGHLEVVKLLVENGAYLGTERGKLYGVALAAAFPTGDSKIVELLVENGADLETEGRAAGYLYDPFRFMDRYGTPLVLASSGGDLESVKILVENGALLDTEGGETARWGNEVRHGTALVLASLNGYFDTVKVLVEKGALLDTVGGETDERENVWRGTALEAASAKGHLEIAELLTKAVSDRAELHAAQGGKVLTKIRAKNREVDDEQDEASEVGRDDDRSSTSGEGEELEFVLENHELECI